MAFDLTSTIPAKGIVVPIYATFTGHAQMPPWWWILTNKFNPKLRLFEDEVELKVKRVHRRLLRDIERVDAPQWKREQHLLTLTWSDTPWTFAANIVRADWRRQTLEFLARKQVPLSPRAARLLNE